MALINAKIAVHWKDTKGENRLKIYNSLDEAERAKKWLIDQGISAAGIELAIVKEKINEPERTIGKKFKLSGDSKLRRWSEQPPVIAPAKSRRKNAKRKGAKMTIRIKDLSKIQKVEVKILPAE